ncbi:MAG: YlbJ [Bacilli bacterium]|nr:YlbJ [Bacilli bacterium]
MRSYRIGMPELIAVMALTSLFMLLKYPEQGLEATLRGIAIWWDILFPALFPFLVISEMLLGFGMVHFLGTLLDPLMRPLFRIPGIGGFVVAMGFASGYPVGARLTSQLWEQGLLNREEGERLVAFTTSSDPIFLIGAVSIGFFHDAKLAVILAISHYGSAFILGLLMRFHGKPALPKLIKQTAEAKGSLWVRAFETMHIARLKDGRPLGTLLQQAIRTSVELIFVIGGLVVFFSVILEYLSLSPIMDILSSIVRSMLQFFHLPTPLSPSLVKGFFEVTLGTKATGQANDSIALMYKVAAAAFILSWGGLSVHAQIVSILHRTNLRYTTFAIARLIHAVLAASIVFIIWKPLHPVRDTAAIVLSEKTTPVFSAWNVWESSAFFATFCCLALLCFYFLLPAIRPKRQY